VRPKNDKRDGVLALLETAFDLPAPEVNARCAFIGDSANDASLFAALPLSVGVANVQDALDRLPTPPAFICQNERGAGFVEFVQHVLAAHGESP
jgi:hydroxymethylpyrimidine pyrophosphatase-like HAD family hydrolase